jgi:hypothetical protein
MTVSVTVEVVEPRKLAAVRRAVALGAAFITTHKSRADRWIASSASKSRTASNAQVQRSSACETTQMMQGVRLLPEHRRMSARARRGELPR